MSYKHKKEQIREDEAMNWFLSTSHATAERLPGDWSSIDYLMQSGATTYYAEVKVRENFTSEQIEQWGGAFFSFTKCEEVRRLKEQENIEHEMLYFNFFSDCLKIYKTPVDPTVYKWELMLVPIDICNPTVKGYKWVAKLTDEYLIETIKYK